MFATDFQAGRYRGESGPAAGCAGQGNIVARCAVSAERQLAVRPLVRPNEFADSSLVRGPWGEAGNLIEATRNRDYTPGQSPGVRLSSLAARVRRQEGCQAKVFRARFGPEGATSSHRRN